jgi:hypothetical protein
MFSWA